MGKIKWKELGVSVLISLLAGVVGSLLAGDMSVYEEIYQPPLAPPAILFPIVWTILYILMGIAAYLVSQSERAGKKAAQNAYAFQLLLNVLWSPIFFRYQEYELAFIILVALWIVILVTIRRFYAVSPLAGKLLIPYLLWVTFAGYLNLAIALNA